MLVATFLAVNLVYLANAYDNGLAVTPQMGWNTWNYFGCSISEDTILGAAKKIVSLGLKDYGYEYVLMDDCWHAPTRNPDSGAPRADPQRFPRGIKALSDEIHALGLKIGIYSDAGSKTCAGRFGSLGYEDIDAKTYAEWGIDYLKYDNCFNEGQSGTPLISYNRYKRMSDALNATGRPILYSMCNWGDDQPWNWAPMIANSWRMSGDIYDTFDHVDDRCPCDDMLNCKLPGFHCSVARIIDYAAPFGQKAGSGQWNDLDMLEVGNGGMTYDEYVAHFSMWAIIKSPLILGNDIINIGDETLSIITNSAIIAINQDSSHSPAIRIWRRPVPGSKEPYSTIAGTPSLQLWMGYLSNWEFVVALLNTGKDYVHDYEVLFEDVFFDLGKNAQNARWRIYDVWQKSSSASNASVEGAVWGKDIGVHQGSLKGVNLKGHSIEVWKFAPEDWIINDFEMRRVHRVREGARGPLWAQDTVRASQIT